MGHFNLSICHTETHTLPFFCQKNPPAGSCRLWSFHSNSIYWHGITESPLKVFISDFFVIFLFIFFVIHRSYWSCYFTSCLCALNSHLSFSGLYAIYIIVNNQIFLKNLRKIKLTIEMKITFFYMIESVLEHLWWMKSVLFWPHNHNCEQMCNRPQYICSFEIWTWLFLNSPLKQCFLHIFLSNFEP